MLNQAAAEQREKAERGYLTSISGHMLGKAGLLFRGNDKRQTTATKVFFSERAPNMSSNAKYLSNKESCSTNMTVITLKFNQIHK